MGQRFEASKTFGADAGAVMAALPAALASIGATETSRDEQTGTMEATRSVGWASWGERIMATVTSTDEGTTVRVESKLKLGLFDWGRNRKNVQGILANVDSQLN